MDQYLLLPYCWGKDDPRRCIGCHHFGRFTTGRPELGISTSPHQLSEDDDEGRITNPIFHLIITQIRAFIFKQKVFLFDQVSINEHHQNDIKKARRLGGWRFSGYWKANCSGLGERWLFWYIIYPTIFISTKLTTRPVVVAAKTTSNAYETVPFPPDPNSPKSTINTVEREIREAGGHATAISVDVRDVTQIENMVKEAVSIYGRLDVLVYNSGAIWWSAVETTPTKRFQLMQKVNPEGLYASVQTVLPAFAKNGWKGRIIVVSPPIYSRFFRGKTAYAIGLFFSIDYCVIYRWLTFYRQGWDECLDSWSGNGLCETRSKGHGHYQHLASICKSEDTSIQETRLTNSRPSSQLLQKWTLQTTLEQRQI